MKSRAELKEMAKSTLKGNWGSAIVVALIVSAISSVASFAAILITAPMAVGSVIWFTKLNNGESPGIEVVFDGFKMYVSSLLVVFFTGLFTFLWSLLFIIPGIIKGLSYSMAIYILVDNPDMSPLDAISESKRMMDGHKMDLFILNLSFLGWALLCCITCGIGFLFLAPYVSISNINFYNSIKETTN